MMKKAKRIFGFLIGVFAVLLLCFFVFIFGFHIGSLNEGRKQRNLLQERIKKLEKEEKEYPKYRKQPVTKKEKEIIYM
ncbi:hypothetical protein HY227_01895 [Candidatus Wolfebacteria bacterium]|nr:hypothetical protein [Candidatus Wolfebacteria bacterium]